VLWIQIMLAHTLASNTSLFRNVCGISSAHKITLYSVYRQTCLQYSRTWSGNPALLITLAWLGALSSHSLINDLYEKKKEKKTVTYLDQRKPVDCNNGLNLKNSSCYVKWQKSIRKEESFLFQERERTFKTFSPASSSFERVFGRRGKL